MGRVRAVSLLLVALAAGLVLTSCGGGGNAELLPGQTADQITSYLDQVNQSVEEGNCEVAEEAVAAVSTKVDGLRQVDPRLKKALRQGAAKLSEVVSTCGAGEEAAEERAAEKAEAEELEQLEAGQQAEEEEQQAFEKEQKAEEREEQAKEKAEERAEQPGPPEEGEESNGKAKGHEKQEESVEPPSGEEELTPEGSGGPAGGIGPGAAAEGSGG